MERRRYPRIRRDDPVQITNLTARTSPVTAQVIDFSGRGLALRTSSEIPVNAAIKIEYGDNLFLGEVCYCQPDTNGFRVGLALEQVIYATQDLLRLQEQVQAAGQRAVLASQPK